MQTIAQKLGLHQKFRAEAYATKTSACNSLRQELYCVFSEMAAHAKANSAGARNQRESARFADEIQAFEACANYCLEIEFTEE